jgi:hypothetical protein
MAVDIKFLIDGADRGQPTNVEEFGVSITEDSKINMRIVSFDNDLIFVGGTFEYIYNNLIDTGGCSLINVEVQYVCAGVWKRLTNGYIIVSECTFDLDKCSVTTKLYDDSFSTKINNNKSIPFFSDSNITKNLQPIEPPTVYYVNLFNPSNNVYQTSSNTGFITIYDALKHLVGCMSDNLVGFESDYFRNQINSLGYGTTLMVTNGKAIRSDSAIHTNLVFETLYNALNKKIRLGMVIERQDNGLPLLRIENYDYFQQLGAEVNLYDQPNIKFNYDTSQLYASVDFGSDPFLNDYECGDDTQRCSFPQTTFRGFRDETFGVLGECNTSNTLDLKSTNVIFDTNVIENIYKYDSETYDNDVVLIDSDWFGFSNPIYAHQGDPLGVGGHVYNPDYINEQVAENWIGGYPNSLYQYLQGFDPNTTIFRAEIQNTLDPVQQFTVGNPSSGIVCYSVIVGSHLNFTNEVIDNGNNFYGDRYIVPFDGIYSFNAQCVKDYATYSPDVLSTFVCKIQRYATDDTTLIEERPGFPNIMTINSGNVTSVTWNNVVCIAGDIIKVDWCGFVVDSSIFYNARIAKQNLQAYKTFFEGRGRPFDRTELVPVDPNTIRRLLYKFDRPLRMEEIESILDNTSRPIQFGQYDDRLRVIKGYINKVDIKSIIKQDASIQLKSNKILR